MTEFSKLEQEMLCYMVELHESQNLCINSWLSKLFADILLENKCVERPSDNGLLIKYQGYQETEILLKIKYLYFLFERLESAHLVKVDHLGKVDFKFIAKDLEKEYFLAGFPYRHLYNFFSMFGYNPILVSHYVIELVENKFRTPEQLRFEKQLNDADNKHAAVIGEAQKQIRIAWAAFSVSFVALIASSVMGIFQMCSETKLDKDQLNQIKQTIQQNTLPDVIKTEITNDTLTTRIVEKPQTRSEK